MGSTFPTQVEFCLQYLVTQFAIISNKPSTMILLILSISEFTFCYVKWTKFLLATLVEYCGGSPTVLDLFLEQFGI